MLRHKIKDIPAEGLVVRQELPQSLVDDALAGDAVDVSRTTASVDYVLTRSGDDVVLHGRMKAALGLACDRCLGPAKAEVQAPLDIVYKPPGDPRDDDEVEGDPLAADDLGEHDHVWVDEEPFLREQLILAVPMSHLCKPDCKGLCPECGQDLNQVACGHRQAGASTGLAAQLQAWKDQHKS